MTGCGEFGRGAAEFDFTIVRVSADAKDPHVHPCCGERLLSVQLTTVAGMLRVCSLQSERLCFQPVRGSDKIDFILREGGL